MTQLGLTLNFKNSCFIPSQRATFIGITLDSAAMKASFLPSRVSNIFDFVF